MLPWALTSKRQKGKNNGEGTCAFPFFDQENAPQHTLTRRNNKMSHLDTRGLRHVDPDQATVGDDMKF